MIIPLIFLVALFSADLYSLFLVAALSVCGDVNYVTFTTNSKSGQFFFFTPDGDYMIKTVSHEEVRELQKIVLQYYEYLQSHPRSFLCRILGMHRVQMYHLNRTIYFIVMASAYKGAPRKMDVQYDCKGSHVGRSAPQDSVKKDNDLLEEGFRLRLGSNREPVVAQVRADVEFLRNLGFLDYSLLIGATYKPVEEASGGGSGSGGAKDGENGASESGAEDETDEEDQEGEEDDGNGHVVAPTTNSKRASFVAPSAPPPPPPPAAAQSPAAATKPTASPKKKSWLFRSSDRRTSSGSAEGGGSNRGSLNHINSEAADVMAQALSPSASSVSSGSAASSDCPAGDPNGGGGGGDGGLRRPAEVLRRNSSRSLQLAYTKQWQSMKSLSALTEEKELMVEATRWSGGAEGGGGGGECGFTVAPSGGLPALPLPPDAPWLMPRKPNVAFEKALLGTATARGSGSGNGKGGEIRESKESFAMTSPMRGLRVSSLASGGGSGTASSDSSSSGAASYDDGIDEYRLGVIDFLTRYGVTKVAERNFKSFKYEKKGLSVAPPNEYAARLVAFVEGIALGDSPPKESNGGYWVQVTLTQAVSGIELGSKTETGAKLESQWKRASATATTTGVSPKLVTAGQLSQSMPASRSSDTAEDSSSSDFGGAMTGACVQSVAENSEAWLAGVRGGDRVHRVNGELVPLKESRRATMERLRRASRPLHLTLERFPTKAEEAKRDSSGRTSAGSEGTGSEGSDAAGRYSGTNVGSSVTAI